MTGPVFDAPRSVTDGERHVQFEKTVSVRVDETDEWITVPLRAVFVDDGLSGFVFEIGPFSIQGADATAFVNALAHYGHLSGDFKEVSR